MVQERRKGPRSRVLQGASVIFNGRQSVMDCRIRNRSEQGMMLRMTDWIALPDIFEVRVSGQTDTRMARLRWRRGDEVGVAFIETEAADQPSNVSYELERRLNDCRAENAALKERMRLLTEG